MDQCQIIPALHSLEGHESCQPACMLQLSALIPKPWQRIAHYASKVPTFRTKWSFQQHFPSRKEKLHYATLPFLAEQREPFVLCHSPTALEWGEKKKVAFSFLGGSPTATPGYSLSPGERQQKENGAPPEARFLLKTFHHSPSFP